MASTFLLTVNPGSSTIKFGIFPVGTASLERAGAGLVDLRRKPLILKITEGSRTADIPLASAATEDQHELMDETLSVLQRHFSIAALEAVGHRVVHGGDRRASTAVHEAFCQRLGWLGVTIDLDTNARNTTWIEGSASKVAVLVIPTAEERITAEETGSVLRVAGTKR